jgi:hypothetical protein
MMPESRNGEAKRVGITGHWLRKHIPVATNTQVIIEELLDAVFYM